MPITACDIAAAMEKYGLTDLGVECSSLSGHCAVYQSPVTKKGWVQLVPAEPGVFWGPDLNTAIERMLVSQ